VIGRMGRECMRRGGWEGLKEKQESWQGYCMLSVCVQVRGGGRWDGMGWNGVKWGRVGWGGCGFESLTYACQQSAYVTVA